MSDRTERIAKVIESVLDNLAADPPPAPATARDYGLALLALGDAEEKAAEGERKIIVHQDVARRWHDSVKAVLAMLTGSRSIDAALAVESWDLEADTSFVTLPGERYEPSDPLARAARRVIDTADPLTVDGTLVDEIAELRKVLDDLAAGKVPGGVVTRKAFYDLKEGVLDEIADRVDVSREPS